MKTLVWYRGKDLRVADHAPLTEAAAAGEVFPLFVLDPYFFAPERAQELPHRMQFLLESLESLARNLERLGSRLLVVEGKSTEVIPKLARKLSVDRVVAHRWVEPFARERDRRIEVALEGRFKLYEGETLLAPGMLRTGAGTPYSVFTQFAKAFDKSTLVEPPLAAPKRLPPLPDVPFETVPIPTLLSLGIPRNPKLLPGGEKAANDRLKHFLQNGLHEYASARNRMDLPGTSRLSADLKFGTLSVRKVWNAVADVEGEGARAYRNELLWREFAHSMLWDRPELLREPFRPMFKQFPWGGSDAAWHAWASGKTGYPIVDAAARQLVGEGFVHNRARMVAASFLTKHLLIDYRRGEAHYMKYLTDGDWAQNNAGWQWSAGCGCDAQPYFRIFNPTTQGKTFDPDGAYIRRWVPELAALPVPYIFEPHTAPPEVLLKAGITLGQNYPEPIIDHRLARDRFLALASAQRESPTLRRAVTQ